MTAALLEAPADTKLEEVTELAASPLLSVIPTPQMGECTCRCPRCSTGNPNAHCHRYESGCMINW
ncbi:hypothetical protein [Streptomyces aquilus]|uniref:hypothetical protein n=1 Tax=Streptomyces aquilus TaxID=2548456 RepID=UPI0036A68771